MSRPVGDPSALKSREANHCFVNETRLLEEADPEEAVKRYRQAIANLREYQGRLYGWDQSGNAPPNSKRSGEVRILDRLTACLVRLGRADEAAADAEAYMKEFQADRLESTGRRIARRIIRAREDPKTIRPPVQVPVERRVPQIIPPGWEMVMEGGRLAVRLSRKKGCATCKHHTDFASNISGGKPEDVVKALEERVVAAEIESEKHPGHLPTLFHWRLAITYRKLKRHVEECLILERFLSFPIAHPTTVSEFKVRLARARQLAARVEERSTAASEEKANGIG